MEREATDFAPKAVDRSPTPHSPESDALNDELPQRSRRASVTSVVSSLSPKSTKSPSKDIRKSPWAEPQVSLLIVRGMFLDRRARCLAV
jgi:hypothetical protein